MSTLQRYCSCGCLVSGGLNLSQSVSCPSRASRRAPSVLISTRLGVRYLAVPETGEQAAMSSLNPPSSPGQSLDSDKLQAGPDNLL